MNGTEPIETLKFAHILEYLRSFFYISLKTFGPMETQTVIVIFAIAATFGLVTVVAIDIILTAQEAEAAGCRRPGE